MITTSKRCYYCGMFKRFAPDMRSVENVVSTFVPAYDDGYEYEEHVLAHPSCTKEHA